MFVVSVSGTTFTIPALTTSLSVATDFNVTARPFYLCLKSVVAAVGTTDPWFIDGYCSSGQPILVNAHSVSVPYVYSAATTFASIALADGATFGNDTLSTVITVTLSGDSCLAGTYFTGAGCVTPSTLANNSFVALKATANLKAFAQVAISSAVTASTASLSLNVATIEGNQSCAVYAHFGAPDRAPFVYVAYLNSNISSQTITVPTPAVGQWFVQLRNLNVSMCSANIRYAVDAATKNVLLSYRETIVSASLTQCGAGQFGINCNTTVTPIGAPGVVMESEYAAGVVQYFAYNGSTDANATAVAVAAAGLLGVPQLAVKKGSLPGTWFTLIITYLMNEYKQPRTGPTTFDLIDCSVSNCNSNQPTLIVNNQFVDASVRSETWYIAGTWLIFFQFICSL